MNTITDEEYFGEMKLMFQSKGWKMLVQDLLENAKSLNDVQTTKDSEELFTRKGQLGILAQLINLEETLARAEKDAEEAAE